MGNLPQWQHGQQPAVGGNFTLDGRPALSVNSHAKMASDSPSWEDLVAGMSAKGAAGK